MSRYVFYIPDDCKGPTGGIMNIVRHCELARTLGADAVLATDSGADPHAIHWFRHGVPRVRWQDRKSDDICVIPDIFSDLVSRVTGRCIVFMQSPLWLRTDFDYKRNDLAIWTDSPMMLEKCKRLYPGKEIPIVPNIVDHVAFSFLPQSRRQAGMIIVFPRKGPDFIKDVFREYRRLGGRYWKPMVIDGLPFGKMAQVFQQAQAFLASADAEGCALPPQESMAAGVVVIGKDANGANFCMQQGQTALVAESPRQAAAHLRSAEDAGLRELLARNGYELIKKYFAAAEPTRFWRGLLENGGLSAWSRVSQAKPLQTCADSEATLGD